MFGSFNTQPPEGGWRKQLGKMLSAYVSTHSRPKAADRVNSEPRRRQKFQHTAARRRLLKLGYQETGLVEVSTHSRPKAAETPKSNTSTRPTFQHTAARRRLLSGRACLLHRQGFNTQPPEGGCGAFKKIQRGVAVSTHSRPKAAVTQILIFSLTLKFQHTAARRRLPYEIPTTI